MSKITCITIVVCLVLALCDISVAQDTGSSDYTANEPALREDFKALDKNNDGYVCAHELRVSIPGIYEDDITSFFDKYDTDRDGVISLEEYLMVAHNKSQNNNQQQASGAAQ